MIPRAGTLGEMKYVTEMLAAVAMKNDQATDALLTKLVHDELRRLAACQMAKERPGQTLNATGLVHEAYLRLVGMNAPLNWNGRGHFFAAAAEAMRINPDRNGETKEGS